MLFKFFWKIFFLFVYLFYTMYAMYIVAWRREEKKKKEEKLIHGAFKQGLPTKIFFHGLVHVDSCDPWETSELRCRKHQGGKYQAFKKLGRSDTVFTAITIFLTRSPFSLFNYIPENIRSSITKFSSLLIFFSLPYTFFPLVSPPLSCPRLLFFSSRFNIPVKDRCAPVVKNRNGTGLRDAIFAWPFWTLTKRR